MDNFKHSPWAGKQVQMRVRGTYSQCRAVGRIKWKFTYCLAEACSQAYILQRRVWKINHRGKHTSTNTDISDGQNLQRTVLYLDCGNSYLSKLCNKKGEFLLYVHLCLNKPNFQKNPQEIITNCTHETQMRPKKQTNKDSWKLVLE